MNRRPRLAITFPNHWSIKNILHAGVAAKLQRHVELVGIADEERIADLIALVARLGLEPMDWLAMPKHEDTRAMQKLRHLQKAVAFERMRFSTERILQRSTRGRRTRLQRLASWLIRPVARSPWGAAWQASLAQERWDRTIPTSVLGEARVDALFATNPVDFREDGLVKEAELLRLPVVTTVPSWDNLSSKGVLFTRFHRIAVWSAVMQQEVLRLLPGVTPAEVPVVGLTRFQAYREPLPNGWDRERFLLSLGLDPAKKTILLANTATSSFPDQPTVAQHLAEAIQSGELQDAQLLVRGHPHDEPSLYAPLASWPNVAVWPLPGMEGYGTQTAPPPDDLVRLAATLRAVDVCVNSASTIALDAAACDVPIVSIAYDGERDLDAYQSVRSFYQYTHQKPLMESGAAPLCESREALIAAIREALDHPERRRAERQQLAEVAGPPDTVQRLADVLLESVSNPEEFRRAS